MNSVVGIVSAGAVLLVIAGAQKLIDPWPAASALRQAKLPASRSLVRAGAGVEIVLGSLFLVMGTAVLSAAVAAVYLAFAGFVVVAMRAGVDGSCGCFGREDTPPSWLHVVANGVVAAAAVAYAVGDAGAPVDRLAELSLEAAVLAASTAVLAAVLVAVYSVAPRTLAAAKLHRT
jgi:uncharacterized membrane protein YphA (DoxX/SURF4 family)